MPYKFWSTVKPKYPCTYVPTSSMPFINKLSKDWSLLLCKQNVIRAYFTYRIVLANGFVDTTLPMALEQARNACDKANLAHHDTDLYDAGLSWQDIDALLF